MKQNEETVIMRAAQAPNTLHIREASGGESRVIAGYAILFDTPSDPLWADDDGEAREVISPEAITRELLDSQDIKMTMFHNGQLILARSNKGAGTLSYKVDGTGVAFEFEAPRTVDGDKALELVKRGDISGCSFAFATRYYDKDFVERTSKFVNGKKLVTYRVKAVTGVYDFTLAANPAYSGTSVEAREFADALRRYEESPARERRDMDKIRRQLDEMRQAAGLKLI